MNFSVGEAAGMIYEFFIRSGARRRPEVAGAAFATILIFPTAHTFEKRSESHRYGQEW